MRIRNGISWSGRCEGERPEEALDGKSVCRDWLGN
jgi:hypothetical protein